MILSNSSKIITSNLTSFNFDNDSRLQTNILCLVFSLTDSVCPHINSLSYISLKSLTTSLFNELLSVNTNMFLKASVLSSMILLINGFIILYDFPIPHAILIPNNLVVFVLNLIIRFCNSSIG